MNKRGFTLIELMIVITVIGLLAAISIPSYQKYISKARAVEGVTTLDSIRKHNQSYYVENNVFDQADVGDPATVISAIANGERITLTDHGWTSLSGTQLAFATQPSNYYFVFVRSSNATTWDKLMTTDGESGSACNENENLSTVSPENLGVEAVVDPNYIWYAALGMGNFPSSDGSGDCKYAAQFVTTWGNGFTTSPIINLN